MFIEELSQYLLSDDDYMSIAERFNKLSHDEKFLVLADGTLRGVVSRATKYNGSLLCRLPDAAWICANAESVEQ